MHRLKSRGIVVLTALGLLAISGIAMADAEDDTVFNFGYHEDSDFFMWNVTSLEYETGEETIADLEHCRLQPEDGDLVVYEYGVDPDDPVSLTVDEVDSEELECGELTGGSVIGPEQQINHGMFLRLFNQMYEGDGHKGCLVRHIAQSDLGIVHPSDGLGADEITFTSVETNCIHGKKGEGQGGPPQHVLDKWETKADEDGEPGRPDHAGSPGGPNG